MQTKVHIYTGMIISTISTLPIASVPDTAVVGYRGVVKDCAHGHPFNCLVSSRILDSRGQHRVSCHDLPNLEVTSPVRAVTALLVSPGDRTEAGKRGNSV